MDKTRRRTVKTRGRMVKTRWRMVKTRWRMDKIRWRRVKTRWRRDNIRCNVSPILYLFITVYIQPLKSTTFCTSILL